MPLARYQGHVTDAEGNVVPSASVTVRKEITGAPLASLYSDREGVTALGNPITADADGYYAFHVSGGAFKITATSGAFSREWRYVAIGTMQEFDLDVLVGLNRKTVRVATTANIAIATALNNGDTLDGVSLVTGDLVLVKNQTTKSQNGVYVVGASPARDTAFDTWAEHVGALITVTAGTVNIDTLWMANIPSGGTLGTTDIVFSKLQIVAGATGATGATGVGLGSEQTLATFHPFQNEPPASNYALAGLRNGHPTLVFNDTTAWSAVFTGKMPRSYLGGGITVYVTWAAIATSGTVGWTVEIERIQAGTLDIDADSFAAARTVTAATVDATSGVPKTTNVAFTSGAQMDSLAAGEEFRIRIARDVANDTAVGDAEILQVEIKET